MGLKTYVTFALGALCTRSAVACDEPDPETEGPGAPGIASVSFSGNGCATGTMDSNFTVGESITLGNFSTEISSTTSPLERTKNCQIHINFSGDNPPDYQLKVKDVALQGYLILESGASATVYVTSFWSQDASKTVSESGTRDVLGGADKLTPVFRKRPSRALQTRRIYHGRSS
jgi:hypothetical protein